MRTNTKIILTSILALNVFFPKIVLAEENALIDPLTPSPTSTEFNCSDFLRYGNLKVSVSSDKRDIKAGDIISFSGELKNTKSVPFTGADVFIKIVKNNKDNNLEYVDIVDQFYAAKNLSIAKGSVTDQTTTSFKFVWKVPKSLIEGDYSVLSYVNISNQYDLNGFSISDDVSNGSFDFHLSSDSKVKPLYFDKRTLSINNEKYQSVGFSPEIGKDDLVNISTVVVNESDKQLDATLVWTLYGNSSRAESSILEKKIEKIELFPGEKRLVSFLPTKITKSNLYVTGEVNSSNSKSYINTSFKKEGISDTQITYTGLTSYPVGVDGETSLFVCYKPGETNQIDNTLLNIKIADNEGNVFFKDSIKIVEGNTLGEYLKQIFIPFKNKSSTVIAEIEKNGKVIDSTTLRYDCNSANNGDCNLLNDNSDVSRGLDESKVILIVVITMLTFLGTALYFINHKRGMNHIYEKIEVKDKD